jgi:hypothetical protein
MEREIRERLAAVVAALSATGLLLITERTTALAQDDASSFSPKEEQPEDYPPGPGREETFYACTACHGFKIVAQQGMVRRQWDETIDLMVERHNMPELVAEDREVVLDYLETTFPPRATGQRGWQNPFLKQ